MLVAADPALEDVGSPRRKVGGWLPAPQRHTSCLRILSMRPAPRCLTHAWPLSCRSASQRSSGVGGALLRAEGWERTSSRCRRHGSHPQRGGHRGRRHRRSHRLPWGTPLRPSLRPPFGALPRPGLQTGAIAAGTSHPHRRCPRWAVAWLRAAHSQPPPANSSLHPVQSRSSCQRRRAPQPGTPSPAHRLHAWLPPYRSASSGRTGHVGALL
jgi:hypothetical protein